MGPASWQPHGLSLSRAEKEEEAATYFTSIHNIDSAKGSRGSNTASNRMASELAKERASAIPRTMALLLVLRRAAHHRADRAARGVPNSRLESKWLWVGDVDLVFCLFFCFGGRRRERYIHVKQVAR